MFRMFDVPFLEAFTENTRARSAAGDGLARPARAPRELSARQLCRLLRRRVVVGWVESLCDACRDYPVDAALYLSSVGVLGFLLVLLRPILALPYVLLWVLGAVVWLFQEVVSDWVDGRLGEHLAALDRADYRPAAGEPSGGAVGAAAPAEARRQLTIVRSDVKTEPMNEGEQGAAARNRELALAVEADTIVAGIKVYFRLAGTFFVIAVGFLAAGFVVHTHAHSFSTWAEYGSWIFLGLAGLTRIVRLIHLNPRYDRLISSYFTFWATHPGSSGEFDKCFRSSVVGRW